MQLFKIKYIDKYTIPVFIFLVIITSYLDSPARKFISVILTLFFIFQYLFIKRGTIKISNAISLFVFLYILWGGITSMFAINILNSLYFLIRIVFFFMLIYVIHKWLDSRKKLITLLKWLFYSGVVSSTFILLDFILKKYTVGLSGEVRMGGIFSNLNSAGYIIGAISVFTYLLFIETKNRIYLFSILLFLFSLVMTGSRASILMVIVVTLIIVVRRKIPFYILVIYLIVFIIGILIFTFYKEIIFDKLRIEHGGSGRNVLYSIGISISKDNPIFGIGFGNLKEVAVNYIDNYNLGSWEKSQLVEHALQSSHNMYIETMAEIGIPGLIIYILLIISIATKFINVNFVFVGKTIYRLFLGMFLGVLVRGLFESNGIICKGWISLDIFFWLAVIIFLKYKNNIFNETKNRNTCTTIE